MPATISATGTTGRSTPPAGNPESGVASTAEPETEAESDDAAEVPTDSPSATEHTRALRFSGHR